MSKKKIILVSVSVLVVLVAGLILTTFAGMNLKASADGALYGQKGELSPAVTRVFPENDENAPEGMVLVKKDGDLSLYMNKEDCSLAVFDGKTGETWYSNPSDFDSDAIALGDVKKRLQSQLYLKYYTDKSSVRQMDSFTYCIATEQFEITPIELGVRVTYTIGKNTVSREMIPTVISKERFEEKIVATLGEDEDAIKTLTDRYKLLTVDTLDKNRQLIYNNIYPTIDPSKELYILDPNCPIYAYESIYNVLIKQAGYTKEDIETDNEENGIVVEVMDLEKFVIPVEYTLEDGGFCARIVTSAIEEPQTFTLTSITLLEFFGAAGLSDEGYMLIPDGSGAMVKFNNGKTDAPKYDLTVYGKDTSYTTKEGVDYEDATTLVPVFGVHKNNKAFLAIIEECDAHANICADISGKTHSYNQVYAEFNIRPYDVMTVSTNNGLKYNNKYQGERTYSDCKVKYLFLEEENGGYVGMANAYRNYLVSKGELVKKDTTTIPFVTELLGQIEASKFFLGVPYTSEEAITSFEEANLIIDELYDLGVKGATVKYSSWTKGAGLYPTAASKASVSGTLGGKNDLVNLNSDLSTLGSSLYLNININNVHDSVPNFNKFSHTNRLTYNQISNQRIYNVATLQQLGGKYYTLSARYLDYYLQKYLGRLNKTTVQNLWFEDVASDLNTDFRKNKNVDRQEVKRLTVEALGNVASSVSSIGLDAANVYAWKYADKIVNLPLTTSGHRMEDDSIPFVQIVLSGMISYTGGVVNTSGQDRVDMLKSVETGAGLYFKWIYEDNEGVKDLEGREANQLYSLYYKDWIDTASQYYNDMNERAGKLIGTEIIGHTELQYNVYKTTYKTGSVIVNYNNYDVEIDGVAVKALDFTVLD